MSLICCFANFLTLRTKANLMLSSGLIWVILGDFFLAGNFFFHLIASGYKLLDKMWLFFCFFLARYKSKKYKLMFCLQIVTTQKMTKIRVGWFACFFNIPIMINPQCSKLGRKEIPHCTIQTNMLFQYLEAHNIS